MYIIFIYIPIQIYIKYTQIHNTFIEFRKSEINTQ